MFESCLHLRALSVRTPLSRCVAARIVGPSSHVSRPSHQPTEQQGHPLRRLRSAATRLADRTRAAVSSASGQSSCLRHRSVLRPAEVRDDVAPVGPDERFLVASDVVHVDLGEPQIDEVLQVLAVPVEVG